MACSRDAGVRFARPVAALAGRGLAGSHREPCLVAPAGSLSTHDAPFAHNGTPELHDCSRGDKRIDDGKEGWCARQPT